MVLRGYFVKQGISIFDILYTELLDLIPSSLRRISGWQSQ